MKKKSYNVHQPNFSKEEYFNYFKMICKEFNSRKLLTNRITEICLEIKEALSKINESNSFNIFSKLLGLDAQLQIISTFIGDKTFDEDEILDMANEDYPVFFKESLNPTVCKNNVSLYLLVS